MNGISKLIATVASLSMLYVAPSFAQDQSEDEVDALESLEEIIVTGRRREETLMDIPVSTSVIGNQMIEDAGLTTLFDMYEMVPGLHYDEGQDRLAALPSIRGIQANDIAPNRTKVTSFVDGIPVLGSAGSIGFFGFQQVEVYRGPQSAAFGRSTFAGAINYVTANPTDTFEGRVGLNFNDFGVRTAEIQVGGPITDSLGFIVSYQGEDSTSPDIWHATGDYGYRNDLLDPVTGQAIETNRAQADGTEFGARTGDNINAKLVFEPDDTLRLAMTFNHVETHDQRAAVMFLTQAERDACFENNGVFVDAGMMAPWLIGEMDCNWDNARDLYSQHDVEAWLSNNRPNLDDLIADAIAGTGALDMGMGMVSPHPGTFTLNDGTVLSIEEQILLMAKAYSIPEDYRGTVSERDRITFQADKLFDNGSAIQFSYMTNDESFSRANATGFYYYDPDNFGIFEDGIPNTYDMNANGSNIQWQGEDMGRWRIFSGMGAPRLPNPSFGEIEEQYAELRWVSPAENRLRFVVGASYYDYDYLEERWGGPGMGVEALAGAAQLNGIVDEFMQLAGFEGRPYAADDEVIGEQAENSALFFNIAYDLSDRMTFSAEGRWASDVVGASNATTGLSEEITTDSFVPRVSLNYDVSDNTSIYVQWAQGVNPAGINVGVLSADTLAILNSGVPNGLIPYDATVAQTDLVTNDTGAPPPDGVSDAYDQTTGVWYTDGTQTTVLAGQTYEHGFTSDDFTAYQEEEISQLEFGFKGNALGGRLTYAGAVYMIDWVDQIQNGSIDIDSPCADNGNAGDPTATLAPCTRNGVDYLWVGAADGSTIATNLNFGDVQIHGAEIEANYRIGPSWDLRAQASIMKGEYDEFCDIGLFNAIDFTELDGSNPAGATGTGDQPDYMSALGLNVRRAGIDDTLTSTCYITDGNTIANQPEFSASISPTYNRDIGNMRFSARLDVRYEGKQYDNSANFNWYPSATTVNLNLSLRGARWDATLYVNNLTEEDSPRNVFGFPDDVTQMGLFDFGNNDALRGTNISNTPMTGYLGETWLYSDLARDSFQFQPRNPRHVGLRATYRF